MTHRPFTARQAAQNRRFLQALRRTGNPRLAADLLGVHRSTYLKRRAKSAPFALAWDAALAAAHAAFNQAGGAKAAAPSPPSRPGEGLGEGKLRTKGGELIVSRTRNGRLQLRRAPRGWMTKAAEQAFFAALSATANVRLSAAAAGFTHSAFYQKKRAKKPFAREMRLALELGYDRVEMAALAAALPDSHEDDAWRRNDPPPIPPMTPQQAFQLLYLHQKEVRLQAEPAHIKRRRGESREAHSFRLSAMYEARLQRDREAFDIAEAERRERGEAWLEAWESEMPVLPALDQVTGWSGAALEQRARSERDGERRPTGRRSRARSTSRHDGALTEQPIPETGPVYNPDLALFGGWRLSDWEKRKTGNR